MSLRIALTCAVALSFVPAASAAQIEGDDARACSGGTVVRVNVTGLKDRTGRLKLELYPATQEDYLKDDHDLKREGKLFQRSYMDTPKGSGAVALCIKAPRPGRYALFLTHDRDGQNKFNFWKDGAGFPSNRKMGRARPKVSDGVLNVGAGTTTLTIKVQYLRGLSGFSPSS